MQIKKGDEKRLCTKGDVYGRLTLTGRHYPKEMYGQLRRIVEADCICGVTRDYLFDLLIKGETKSCGCLQKELSVKRFTTHGLSSHPLYLVYHAMRARCYRDTDEAFENYGGRGIEICDEWLDDFTVFYDWSVENGYQTGKSIDRIDNEKGYSPENCRWADRETQSRNNRRNKMITAFGETKCLFDWAKDSRCKVSVWGLRNRFDRGKWTDMEEMISAPEVLKKDVVKKSHKSITAFGETKNMAQWVNDPRCKVKLDSLRDRLKSGMPNEEAISRPPTRKNGKLFD